MILRFMRDDAMTSGRRKINQTALRTPRKNASRFCGFISVTPRRQNYGSIRNGDPRMTFAAMPSGLVEAIGAAGAVLTTVCWVPQAAKIIRERDTRAISLPGTALCVFGVFLWLVYGLAIVDGPLIGSSIVTFAMTFIILVLKIRHG
jgi:MtN3 and saliva related transmembrane protein